MREAIKQFVEMIERESPMTMNYTDICDSHEYESLKASTNCNHIYDLRHEKDGDINSPAYAVCKYCGEEPDLMEKKILQEMIKLTP